MQTILILSLILTLNTYPNLTVDKPEVLNVNLPTETIKTVSRGTGEVRMIEMSVTAYHESECNKKPSHPEYGITYSGKPVKEWYTIAAAPMFPLGTVMYIPHFKDEPNHGIFVVEDRGTLIVDKHKSKNPDMNGLPCVDVYMSDLGEVDRFGRQRLEVYVLE